MCVCCGPPCRHRRRSQGEAAGGDGRPPARGSPAHGRGVRPGLRRVSDRPHLLGPPEGGEGTALAACWWSTVIPGCRCCGRSARGPSDRRPLRLFASHTTGCQYYYVNKGHCTFLYTRHSCVSSPLNCHLCFCFWKCKKEKRNKVIDLGHGSHFHL